MERYVLLIVLLSVNCFGDKPCSVRKIIGQSVVCVCNSTYCDEVRRRLPDAGRFVIYESNEAGARFEKYDGNVLNYDATIKLGVMLELDPSTQYQQMIGFGGAITDSSGINWKSLSDEAQQQLINAYFSESGIEYSVLRVPIAGSDFSTRKYAYNESPKNDVNLSNYTLAPEDLDYKIPFIKAALAVSPSPIFNLASPWSPPDWMKEGLEKNMCGRLKKEYFQTYADYLYTTTALRFFLSIFITTRGVPIWGLTPVNEPTNGIKSDTFINCMNWNVDMMGNFIKRHLGPTIRSSNYSDVKIVACDDQRPFMPYWVNGMFNMHPETLDFVDGLAVHYYFDTDENSVILDNINKKYPSKFIMNTEASVGMTDIKKVQLGSWSRAERYIKDIIQDLNLNLVGWLDWNLCLDMFGGPSWCNNLVDAPILIDAIKGEFIKQPMFYALGHFSKFIPRGSRRLKINSKSKKNISHVGFITPQNTAVVIIYNDDIPTVASIKLNDKQVIVPLEKKSIVTVEIRPE
ncbi:unnamed protein product [Pieris macdunnoughi]|uniref:Glucosylceramidase n=1 Tax=Pieris macdunnoughi TaxID=345717 RepID=A0A821U7L3_9NEOP|nr:unnamed protein product [Pieris macdunnoughi]